MADTGADKNNFWQSADEQQPSPEELAPAAAPPPPEVKVRTLRSDLESMAESGGLLPQFQTVRAPALGQNGPSGGGKGVSFGTIVVALIAIVLLGAIIYLVYQIFFNEPAQPAAAPPEVSLNLNAAKSPATPTTPPLVTQGLVHHSLFTKPIDQILTLALPSAAQSATDLKTFSQRLSELLASGKPTSTIFEINVENTDGNNLDVSEIFQAADIGVLDSQFVAAHFNADATFFVYKDKKGYWPGYVMALKPTENWLFLRDDVQKLEGSNKIANFFLSSPGDKAADFKDNTISGQPVRALAFSAPGANFVYGWFRGNLVLSTSIDGLKEAAFRL